MNLINPGAPVRFITLYDAHVYAWRKANEVNIEADWDTKILPVHGYE